MLMKETHENILTVLETINLFPDSVRTLYSLKPRFFFITMFCYEDIFSALVEDTNLWVAWNTLKDKFEKINNTSMLMLLDKSNSVCLQGGGLL